MIGADKIGHFVVGAAIGGAALALTGSPSLAFAAAVAAGVVKEARDGTGRGTVDLWDFVATALGGAAIAGFGLA